MIEILSAYKIHPGGNMFEKLLLDNGVRVVYEQIPYVRSISVGVWIGTGSRSETIENNGISHFIEHMLFKGTKRRNAKEIAACIDNIGGQLNAFTGKECTCYYTKTLDTHLEISLDILSDMLFRSKLALKDLQVERKVIMEEIGMYEDSPEELVHDILSEAIWSGNSLSYPILGTENSLKQINKDVILQYMENNYTPENAVIAIAGNFDPKELMKLIKKYFGKWKSQGSSKNVANKPEFINTVKVKEKDTEQVHLCVGFEGIEQGNDSLYSLLAVNNVFGGGMSSRLFQKIREEKGLVYSVYSYPSSYRSTGLFTIYAGMNPEHMPIVIELLSKEIDVIVKNGITEDELLKSKEQLKGSYILGLESTSGRMNSIGKAELMLGNINTPEEILQKIDDVSMDQVVNVISTIFASGKRSFSVVGNIKKEFDFKSLIV